MIVVKNITKLGEKMKKFVDYIMAQPVWKVVLYGLGIIFMIFNPKTILPILFLGGAIALWYFAKKKPNVAKRNIAALVAILGAGGLYLTNPQTVSTTEEQTQATHFASFPSKNDEKAEKETESKREKEAKEKAEKEKEEKERKVKEEQERKEKEEREKKAKEEQERKEKEEREKKEAEAKQLADQAEASVQQLENNQIQENVDPAQVAVDRVVDPTVKATLTERIGRVQNAINEKAKVEAQQAAVAQQAADQEQRIVYVAQYGKSPAYWYNINNMPSNTRKDKVITMSEADAIRAGKHHSNKE